MPYLFDTQPNLANSYGGTRNNIIPFLSKQQPTENDNINNSIHEQEGNNLAQAQARQQAAIQQAQAQEQAAAVQNGMMHGLLGDAQPTQQGRTPEEIANDVQGVIANMSDEQREQWDSLSTAEQAQAINVRENAIAQAQKAQDELNKVLNPDMSAEDYFNQKYLEYRNSGVTSNMALALARHAASQYQADQYTKLQDAFYQYGIGRDGVPTPLGARLLTQIGTVAPEQANYLTKFFPTVADQYSNVAKLGQQEQKHGFNMDEIDARGKWQALIQDGKFKNSVYLAQLNNELAMNRMTYRDALQAARAAGYGTGGSSGGRGRGGSRGSDNTPKESSLRGWINDYGKNHPDMTHEEMMQDPAYRARWDELNDITNPMNGINWDSDRSIISGLTQAIESAVYEGSPQRPLVNALVGLLMDHGYSEDEAEDFITNNISFDEFNPDWWPTIEQLKDHEERDQENYATSMTNRTASDAEKHRKAEERDMTREQRAKDSIEKVLDNGEYLVE